MANTAVTLRLAAKPTKTRLGQESGKAASRQTVTNQTIRTVVRMARAQRNG
jgi:hypothetical protein